LAGVASWAISRIAAMEVAPERVLSTEARPVLLPVEL
jgi:hypothetical protein